MLILIRIHYLPISVESQYFEPENILPEEELEEFSSVNHTELKLYSFQEELAQPSKEGQNRLIVAPTNSGKTFVAMAIAKVWFIHCIIMFNYFEIYHR